MNNAEYARRLDEHYAVNWSTPVDTIRWEAGPTHDLPPEFRVLEFQRSPGVHTYATRCMSQPADKMRLEVHAFCRIGCTARSNLVEILTSVAHYHRTGRKLGIGHTVNFGKPWITGATCSYGILSLPYLDGPGLEWMVEPKVRFLWLIPVTGAEVQYKKAHGMDALEQKFEELGFNYLDPQRASVV